MSLGSPFLNKITIFASYQLSGICFVFSMLIKIFVREVRTLCPPSLIITLAVPSIPLALCLFILFVVLSTSSSVNSGITSVSGLDFIVLYAVGTVWVWSDL